jgi:hypothetical protein
MPKKRGERKLSSKGSFPLKVVTNGQGFCGKIGAKGENFHPTPHLWQAILFRKGLEVGVNFCLACQAKRGGVSRRDLDAEGVIATRRQAKSPLLYTRQWTS